MPELAAALDAIGALDAHVRRASRQRTLRIGVAGSLCNWWLIRRLPRFATRHPAIDLDLRLRKPARPPASRSTCAFHGCSRTRPAVRPRRCRCSASRCFRCAPALCPAAPVSPDALLSLPLIHKDAANQTSEWSWETWFRRLGLKHSRTSGGGLQFGEIGLCLAAAAEGAGVALGRSLLVSDAVADGRLIKLFPDGPVMESRKVHVARWPAELSADKDIQSFVRWLADEAEQTCHLAA